MSKKKPTKPTPTPPRPAASVAAAAAPRAPRMVWPAAAPDADAAPFRRIFIGLLVAMCAVMMAVSQFTGVNGDDEFQVDYSEKIVNYYTTMGQDTAALYIEKGKMHYYGGTFELLAGGTNRVLGNAPTERAYHNVRHLFIALFGGLALLFTGLLVQQLAGWRAAVLALVLLFLSPRFFGHAMMNPKDIPFAAGFAMSLYYLVRWLRALPGWDWRTLLGLAVGIGISIGMRAGGVLVIAYLGLFAGIDFLLRYGVKGVGTHTKTLLTYAATGAGASMLGYALAVATWPAALRAPLELPFEALSEFSKLGIQIRVLFEGANVMSDETPWYYAPLWIVKTIPFYALLGVAGGVALLPLLWRRYALPGVLLVAFAAVFPVAYVIYKDSVLHDGWRHLLFAYPAMIALATLLWVTLEDRVRDNKMAKYALYGVLAATLLEPAVHLVRNPTVAYVYFNPIGGGLSGAYGHYETDYWGVGMRQAVNWLEAEGVLHADLKDTVRITSSFFYNLKTELDPAYRDHVKLSYVRPNSRYANEWDYGLFPTRYIRGAHLQSGNWPTSKTAHTIRANGTPLVIIEKDTDKHIFKAEAALKAQDFATAIAEYEAELKQYPDNEIALGGMANAYLSTGNLPLAEEYAQKMLALVPDSETALLYLGVILLNRQDVNGALGHLNRLLEVDTDNSQAHYYIAMCHRAKNELTQALQSTLKAIEKNPRFKAAYSLAAELYQLQGDANTAAKYQNAANQL